MDATSNNSLAFAQRFSREFTCSRSVSDDPGRNSTSLKWSDRRRNDITITDLGSFGGTRTSSLARHLNSAGVVVGEAMPCQASPELVTELNLVIKGWGNYFRLMKGLLLVLSALFLISMNLLAWTNGELLIWMDADQGHGLAPIAKKFENDFGLKVTIEAPEKITDSFPIAAQMAKGPDIVFWAHDEVGGWADAGLIAPVQVSEEFGNKFFPQAWQAVLHGEWMWGYPIALETVTLIYNKKLLDGPPPTQLSELVSQNEKIKKEHPGVTTILWDYKNSYYSWGVLASAGGYVFAKNGADYDLTNVGVADRGAVEGLSKIIALINAGVLPKSVSYSAAEDLMGQGKLAMMISGPWSWSNLIKNGIDFGVAPMPGVDENVGRPFVGVTVAYLNRSSPNQDLAKEFLERYALTEEGLTAIYHAKPTGIPAVISMYEKLAKDNPLLRQLKASVDYGQVMPNTPQMGRFFSSVGAALQIATEGRASAKAALQEAAANMRQD